MKKNSIFCIFFIIFFFLSGTFSFAQNSNLHGNELCTKTYDFIKSFNFKTEILPLIASEKNTFPFNIKLSIPSEKSLYKKNYSPKNLTNLTVAFKIEDVLPHADFFTELFSMIKKIKSDYDLDFIFTYGDENKRIIAYNLKGTSHFISNLQNQNQMAVLCVNFTNEETQIIPGGKTDSSPVWLIKRVSESFFENKIDYSLQSSNITGLYRFNLLKTDERTSAFLQEHIPSLCVNLSENETYFYKYTDFFVNFFEKYSQTGTSVWDRHFFTLTIGTKIIYFNEFFITLLYIITILINIFLVCFFSFKFNHKIKDSVKKSWFIIPGILILTVITLILAQLFIILISKIFTLTSFFKITLKILLPLLIFPVALYFFNKKNLIQEEKTYTYFCFIVSIFNLILFGLIDISLFFLFLFQHLIIFISRYIKHFIPLAVFFIFLLLPYIPYFIQFLKFTTEENFNVFINCSFLINLALSFALLPIELFILRLVSKLKQILDSTDEETKKFQKQNIVAISISLALFLIIFVVLVNFLPNNFISSSETKQNFNFIQSEKDLIKIDVKKSKFFEETSFQIEINLSENAEQCLVSVSSSSVCPIIYSDDIHFSNKNNFTDYFLIPNFPPKNLNFSYISQTKEQTILKVQAVFLQNQNDYILQEKSIIIPKVEP